MLIVARLRKSYINLKAREGFYERETAIVDTGAEVSLLPTVLMETIEYRIGERGKVSVNQAGIAKQTFEVTEAFVKIFFEDLSGSRTQEYEIRVWFADTDLTLIGFDGVLDRAILHLDMVQREGYLEFPDE